MPEIEPTLREILKSELEGHLVTITDYLDASNVAPAPLKASEALLRAVHTMHGAISMVDLPVLGVVFGPLESYVKRLRAQEEAPDRRGLMAIQEASELVSATLARLDTPGAVMPRADDLVAEMIALRDRLPEPASALAAFSLSMEDDDEFALPALAAADEPEAVAIEDFSFLAAEDAPAEAASEIEELSFSDELLVDPALVDAIERGQPETPFDLAIDEPAEGAIEEPIEAAAIEEPIEAAAVESEGAEASTAWDLMFAESVPEAPAEAMPVEAEAVADDWLRDAQGAEPSEAVAIEPSEEMLAALEQEGPPEEAPELVSASDQEELLDLADELADDEEPVPLEGEPAFDELDESVEMLDEPVAAETERELERIAAEEPMTGTVASAPAVELAAIAEDPDPVGVLVLQDMDEDLLEIFVDEGVDILDRSDALVAQLREAPGDREAITGLQRHMHTLKGNARAVGLAGIGDLSHAMESVIEGAVSEELTLDRHGVALMERGFDKLHHLVSRVSKRLAIGVPGNMIARFEALAAGESIVAEPAPEVEAVAEVPVATEAPELETTAEARAPEPAPAPKRRPRAAPRVLPEPVAEEEGARPQQEMIRVRSDLLDALVNFAGEVSIYRSRLEQQMGSYRFNLVELEQTVLRLREQLRKLELETEAQIIARYQREAEAGGVEEVFDPLELDRFSNIQQLSRALAESVSDLVALQNALDDLTRQSETLLLQQSRVSSELQEGLMRTRMVPFDSVVPFLRRLVRQTADELGKRAILRIEGAQGEMDRNLLERMKAPFEHMLRNAMAHGIESPADRLAAGKPEEGSIRIQVSREATEVVLKVPTTVPAWTATRSGARRSSAA
jgi:chemosensory pili system protein ChpA (sensor histidine kinase/response regulator)